MRLPPHVAVIFDSQDTLLRVYVNEDHEDGNHMFTIEPGEGERVVVLPKSKVRGLSLSDIGKVALAE